MRHSPLIAVVLLLTAGVSVHAQELTSDRFRTTRIVPVEALVVPAPAAPAPADAGPAAEETVRQGGGLFSFTSIAHAIGGALVGGFVGFVGAQVVKSDWDKETNSSFVHQRSTWVAGGAVIGVLGSRLIGRTATPMPGPVPMRRARRNRDVLTAGEIAAADVENAYDLILNLRKEWLIPRGTNSWAETDQGEASGFGRTLEVNITPGRDKIIVYFDDVRIGGVEEMKGIPVDLLTRAEFIDARRATYRYGAGHAHGVIRLSSETPAP